MEDLKTRAFRWIVLARVAEIRYLIFDNLNEKEFDKWLRGVLNG